MHRKLALTVALLVALVLGVIVSPSLVVKARGNSLSGMTHLNVKEQAVKQLMVFVEFLQPGDFDAPFLELRRDGSFSTTPYSVPSDQVFIVIDIRFSHTGQGGWLDLGQQGLTLMANQISRFWVYPEPNEKLDSNTSPFSIHRTFTGGIAFDPQTAVSLHGQTNFVIPNLRVELLGYETAVN